jgi:hypothetical protein
MCTHHFDLTLCHPHLPSLVVIRLAYTIIPASPTSSSRSRYHVLVCRHPLRMYPSTPTVSSFLPPWSHYHASATPTTLPPHTSQPHSHTHHVSTTLALPVVVHVSRTSSSSAQPRLPQTCIVSNTHMYHPNLAYHRSFLLASLPYPPPPWSNIFKSYYRTLS